MSTQMFRKTILALGATVALATAALAPTSASAFGHGHGHGFRGPGIALGVLGLGVLAAAAYDAPRDCYIVRRVVRAPYGPEVRNVQVCE